MIGKKYSVRVSSQSYKAPELLIEHEEYDYAMDMWSFGAMFAGIIFKTIPFLPGKNLTDQLVVIANVLGTDELYNYLNVYNLTLPRKFDGLFQYAPSQRKSWISFMNGDNKEFATPDALDLIDKLLR